MSDEIEELQDFFTMIPPNREGIVLKQLSTAIGTELNHIWTGLEHIRKSKLLSYSSGDELDYIGSYVLINRIEGESDEDYRTRLADTVLDLPKRNTIQALKDTVEVITGGYVPRVREFFELTPEDISFLEGYGYSSPYGVVNVEIPIAYDDVLGTIRARLQNVKAAGVSLIISKIQDFAFTIEDSVFIDTIFGSSAILYLEEKSIVGWGENFGEEMIFGQFVFGGHTSGVIPDPDKLDLIEISFIQELVTGFYDDLAGELDVGIDEDYVSISITEEQLFGIWLVETITVFIIDELAGLFDISFIDDYSSLSDLLGGEMDVLLDDVVSSLVDDLIDLVGLATIEQVDIIISDEITNVSLDFYESSDQWTFGTSSIFGQVYFGGGATGNADQLELIMVDFIPDSFVSISDILDMDLLISELITITIDDQLNDLSGLFTDDYTILIDDELGGTISGSFSDDYSGMIVDEFSIDTIREEPIIVTINDEFIGHPQFRFYQSVDIILDFLTITIPFDEPYVGSLGDSLSFEMNGTLLENISNSNIYDSLDDSSLTFVSWLFGNPEATFGQAKFGGSHTSY